MFVSTKPIQSKHSDGTLVNTTYREHVVREMHLIGGVVKSAESVVYISEDITGELAADAARIMIYFNRLNCYLTFTAPGLLEGNSHQLALAAACMGLPPVAAITGGIQLLDYPAEPAVTDVRGVGAKLTAATASGMRLIAPIGSIDSVSLTQNTTIVASDVISGSISNPLWRLIGVMSSVDLISSTLSVVASTYLIKIGKEDVSYVGAAVVNKVSEPTVDELNNGYQLLLNAYTQALTNLNADMAKYGMLGRQIIDAVNNSIAGGMNGKYMAPSGLSLTLDEATSLDQMAVPDIRYFKSVLGTLGLRTAEMGGEKSWKNLPLVAGVLSKYKDEIKAKNVEISQSLKGVKTTGPMNLLTNPRFNLKPTAGRRKFLGEQSGPSTVLQEPTNEVEMAIETPSKKPRGVWQPQF